MKSATNARMKLVAFAVCYAACTAYLACTPGTVSAPPANVATDAGDCALAQAVCAARLIKESDGGAYCPPCP
jgi:hypothetical protein